MVSFDSRSQSWRALLPWLLLLLCAGCHKGRPDLGTLPKVQVSWGRSTPPKESKARASREAQVSSSLAPATPSSDPPDPEPLRSDDYLYYTFSFKKGEVAVQELRRVQLVQPASTPRRVGRFALELWVGHELLERVRFDFPLLAAETNEAGDNAFEAGLSARAVVKVPYAGRATTARVLDRKTRKVFAVAWPPDLSPAAAPDAPAASSTDQPQGAAAHTPAANSTEKQQEATPNAPASGQATQHTESLH